MTSDEYESNDGGASSYIGEEYDKERIREKKIRMQQHEDDVWNFWIKQERSKKTQAKLDNELKPTFDNFNKHIVEKCGNASRKIITKEDRKDFGKVAFQKMYGYMATQAIGIQLKKNGLTKLTTANENYNLFQLLDVVADNGLKALQKRELNDLKSMVHGSGAKFSLLKKDLETTILEQISEEISEREVKMKEYGD